MSNLITKKQLSPDQQAGLLDMMTFMQDTSQREMVLTGAAGTGKTSLLNVFLKEVTKKLHLSYYCTAYTNEAVRVLSMKCGKDFDKTIFSLLGFKLENNEGNGKILVREGKSIIDKYDLIVIDEASMINDELFKMIHLIMLEHPTLKFLYVGDEAQLPPVKYDYSIVFREIKHVFRLNKIMRVSEDNPIINLVTPIREKLFSKYDVFQRVDAVNADGEGVHFYNMKPAFFANLINDFKSPEYTVNKNFCRILAYTNDAVDASNNYIRRHIFGMDVDEFVDGDDLIVDDTYNVRLANGKSFSVYNTGERLSVKRAHKTVDPSNGITTWNLYVDNYNASPKNREDRWIRVVAREGWEKYCVIKYELIKTCRKLSLEKDEKTGLTRYTKKEAWAALYDFIDSFAYVKYAYAMTVHKAQGSTIDNVYVIENDINRLDWNVLDRNKLKYTAFTRAAKNLHIYCP